MNSCRIVVLLFGLLILTESSFAQQDSRANTDKLVRSAANLLKAGKALAALKTIESAFERDDKDGFVLQELAWYRSLVGDYQGATAARDE